MCAYIYNIYIYYIINAYIIYILFRIGVLINLCSMFPRANNFFCMTLSASFSAPYLCSVNASLPVVLSMRRVGRESAMSDEQAILGSMGSRYVFVHFSFVVAVCVSLSLSLKSALFLCPSSLPSLCRRSLPLVFAIKL